MPELIKVMATKVDDRVTLWEVHPDHPTGEVWIVGDGKAHEVAVTPRVQTLLNTGALIRLQAHVESEPQPAEPEPVVVLPDGYEAMTAADVVASIPSWTPDEIATVREYEQANKARSTVLKALG
jgi:hypothetical protein